MESGVIQAKNDSNSAKSGGFIVEVKTHNLDPDGVSRHPGGCQGTKFQSTLRAKKVGVCQAS